MKKTTMFKMAGIAAGVALPVAMVFAQSSSQFTTTPPIVPNQTGALYNGVQTTGLNYSGSFVERSFGFLAQVLRAIPPLLVAIAGVVFMFEVIRFITTGRDGDVSKKEEIRKHILWSLLALVLLLGFWGIVGMVSKLIGVRTGESVTGGDIPRVYITPN